MSIVKFNNKQLKFNNKMVGWSRPEPPPSTAILPFNIRVQTLYDLRKKTNMKTITVIIKATSVMPF